MYRDYFGLTSLPFKTTPDVEFFYKHGSRQDILNALYYAVDRGDAILKVVGEVGSGKTMLLRLLADKLIVKGSCYNLIYINSPNLSSKDILLYIASEFGLNVSESAPKFTILNLIKHHILDIHATGGRVVMLIDEAQSMTIDGLEELRLLSNFETETDKLLQIVLFGQPELDIALNNSKIRQLRGRISYSIYIPALTSSEVHEYLNFRLRKCNYSGLDVFNMATAKKLHKMTSGYPRAINILADKLLMAAYGMSDRQIKIKHFKTLADTSFTIKNYLVWLILGITILLTAGYIFKKESINELFFVNKQISVAQSDLEDSFTRNPEPVHEVLDLNQVNSEPEHLVQKESESASIVDMPNYLVKDDGVSKASFYIAELGGLGLNHGQLTLLIQQHNLAKDWLLELPADNYVLQLSTVKLDSVAAVLKTLETNNILDGKLIRYLIDFNPKNQQYRVKFLYIASVSYSGLVKSIDALPENIKRSKPFVTSVKQLIGQADLTYNQLQQDGIVHVYP